MDFPAISLHKMATILFDHRFHGFFLLQSFVLKFYYHVDRHCNFHPWSVFFVDCCLLTCTVAGLEWGQHKRSLNLSPLVSVLTGWPLHVVCSWGASLDEPPLTVSLQVSPLSMCFCPALHLICALQSGITKSQVSETPLMLSLPRILSSPRHSPCRHLANLGLVLMLLSPVLGSYSLSWF